MSIKIPNQSSYSAKEGYVQSNMLHAEQMITLIVPAKISNVTVVAAIATCMLTQEDERSSADKRTV